jgi:glutamyl-tRNA reductase
MLFRNHFPRCEAAILSTCNRVEILVASDEEKPAIADVLSFIAQARDLPVNQFKTYLYTLSGEQGLPALFPRGQRARFDGAG